MGDPRDVFLPEERIDYSCLENGFEEILNFDECDIRSVTDLLGEYPHFIEDLECLLHNTHMIPDNWDFPMNDLCVVSYRYSEKSEYNTGIFLTSKPRDRKDIIDGLPGSSTESLNGRFYAGIVSLKNPSPQESEIVIKKCLGNGIIPARDNSQIDESRENLALANLLINYLRPREAQAF